MINKQVGNGTLMLGRHRTAILLAPEVPTLVMCYVFMFLRVYGGPGERSLSAVSMSRPHTFTRIVWITVLIIQFTLAEHTEAQN